MSHTNHIIFLIPVYTTQNVQSHLKLTVKPHKNKTSFASLLNQSYIYVHCMLMQESEMVNVCDSPDRGGGGDNVTGGGGGGELKVPGSAPPSACSSPVHGKPKKFREFFS